MTESKEPRTVENCLKQYKDMLSKFNEELENSNKALKLELLLGGMASIDGDLKFIQYTYDDDEWLCDYTKTMREQLNQLIEIAKKELEKLDSNLEQ